MPFNLRPTARKAVLRRLSAAEVSTPSYGWVYGICPPALRKTVIAGARLACISHQLSTRSLFPTRFYLPRPCGRAGVGEAERAVGPVDTLPAKRVRHGWRTLGLRAEQDSGAKQVPASTALCSKNVLNVMSTTPPRIFLRAPCIHGHLRALATTPGEKYRLGP